MGEDIMKLLILCVDGFDPDYALENGFDVFRYSSRLTIPKECYVDTPDGPTPHTDRVWPSIFSGRIIDYGRVVRTGLRKVGHDALVKARITWTGKPRYRLDPSNENMETVFTGRDAFLWNIPTICPEWIVTFPSMDQFMEYCRREYRIYSLLAVGLDVAKAWDVAAIYTRILDAIGHTEPDRVMGWYYNISAEARRLANRQEKRGDHLMLISDHGCVEGRHTDYAYIGATFPFEAENITDIRRVIEEVLDQ